MTELEQARRTIEEVDAQMAACPSSTPRARRRS